MRRGWCGACRPTTPSSRRRTTSASATPPRAPPSSCGRSWPASWGGGREVTIASTRAGHIPGVHRVGFDSAADQITLVHTARSRDGFAAGALAAARWLPGRRGVFAFADVLDEILEAERKATP